MLSVEQDRLRKATTKSYNNAMEQVISQLQSFLLWAGGLAAGTAIGWFMLPHIGGHIQRNLLLLLTIIVAIAFYAWKIQPLVDWIIPMMQWLNQIYYQTIPQQYAAEIWDLWLLALSVYCYKLTVHPEHAKI